MIEGGYILQPRNFDNGKLSKCPPHVREIFSYLVRKANHSDAIINGFEIKRGQLFTSYSTIIEDLSWYVGYRKMTYKKSHCEIAMKVLTKHGTITTTKTTRGIHVTICNYDSYQDPKRYESHNENYTKAATKLQRHDTINKNDKNEKNKELNKDILTYISSEEQKIIDEFNNICTSLPKITTMTKTRKDKIKTRLKEFKKLGIDVSELFKIIEESDYLTGRNGRWSYCSFDWIFKNQENWIKIWEGNYNNKQPKQPEFKRIGSYGEEF